MDPSYSVRYRVSQNAAEYARNYAAFAEEKYDLVWGVGYTMAEAITTAAKAHPRTRFVLVDGSVGQMPANMTCVVFKVQESAFLVGYIAARKTSSDKVGFIGGEKSAAIAQFEFGFRAGVAYGAKERKKSIAVDAEYTNSFDAAAAGRSLAKRLYAQGNDILFAAAGNTGAGVIAEARTEDKLAEGVDLDQSYLAPQNVLVSSVKNVGTVLENLSQNIRNGENDGQKTLYYGMKENAVGIPYTEQMQKMCGQEVVSRVKELQQKVVEGKITPPADEASYRRYLQSLG